MEYNISFEGATLRAKSVELFPSAPTLVFLHDSLGCIKLWRDFPERLAQACQCNYFIYDREGYGASSLTDFADRQKGYMEKEADKLARLLKQEKIEQPILFGHSDGGTIAMIAAAKYPQQIKAFIAQAAHFFVEEVTIQGIYQAIEAYNTTNLGERIAKYHGERTPHIFRAWTQTWIKESYQDWNIEHFFSQIQCPSMVIQGTDDEYGSMKQVNAMLEQTKPRPWAYLPDGVKHSPHKEKPEDVLEETKTFILSVNKKI